MYALKQKYTLVHIHVCTNIMSPKIYTERTENRCKIQLNKCEKRLVVMLLSTYFVFSVELLAIQLPAYPLVCFLIRSHVRQAAVYHGLRGWFTLTTCSPLRRTSF